MNNLKELDYEMDSNWKQPVEIVLCTDEYDLSSLDGIWFEMVVRL